MQPLSRRWLQPAGLYVVALVAGALAAAQVAFPPTEVSAYVVGVARNLVEGQGFVTDALWSYAAGPLTVPRPAFDLWQPLPGFLAAAGMLVLGPSLTAAQAATGLLAAAVAPMTWAVASDAATRNGLQGRRATTVAVGAGLVAAVFGPFLLAVAGPDSTAPFTVFAVAACLAMPRAIGGGRGAGLLLGLLLGLAYLSRQEAIWLGVAYLVLLVGSTERGRRLAELLARAALARPRRARRGAALDRPQRADLRGRWRRRPGAGERRLHAQRAGLRLRRSPDPGGLPGGRAGGRPGPRRRGPAPRPGRRPAGAGGTGRPGRADRPGRPLAHAGDPAGEPAARAGRRRPARRSS